ncbi:MAG: Gp138 family membrane-puncturing spike protein [Burkholderiales bacterium]
MPTKVERIQDPVEALRQGHDGRQAQVQTSMPAIVQAVNFESYSISAQPAIQSPITDKDGKKTYQNIPLLGDVPIVCPRGGGFALTLPIQQGDNMLVVFGSRCIDNWYQSGGTGPPAEDRMHDLSDGLAIPGPTTPASPIPNISQTRVELRDQAGTTLIAIDREGNIEIKALAKVMLSAPEFEVTADTIKIMGNVEFSGGSVKSNGKRIDDTHMHSGVDPGAGISGPPV